MDKGAHFYRCDFQVHTPRDTQWSGPRPVSDLDRKTYAEGFIKACRTKGLRAVAITDHHDLAFFPFIRAAALSELDTQGQPISDQERIHVFPGMEMTLAVPCQALLLFDSDFPADLFEHVMGRLGIVCHPAGEEKHPQTERLPDLDSLGKVCELLDVLPYARGRYILLPNVSDDGLSTLLRKGFTAEYCAMPCVGGYLDHQVSKLTVGNRDKLEGKNKEYGFKALGIFPTSDNRSADFSKLGVNTAWVKWTVPTAEALRQACLARKTRISHSQPVVPAILLARIEVSNSKFLGPLNLELNPQFNCLIGGRGTGKSTVLEYLRWALCDQPPPVEDPSENGSPETKRRKLIDSTLKKIGGVVTVDVLMNGVCHTVRRNSETGEVFLKIGTQPMNPATEDEIRKLLPVQAYSQKQLSGVGVRCDELIRFVEAAGTRELLDQLSAEANSMAITVRRAFQELEEKRAQVKNGERLTMQLSSLEQQLAALKGGLVGINPEDQTVLAAHEQFLAGNTLFDQWQQDTKVLADQVQQALRAIESLPHRLAKTLTIPAADSVTGAEKAIVSLFQKARGIIEEAGRTMSSSSPEWNAFQESKAIWITASREHQSRYGEVQSRLGEHQQSVKLIASLEEQIAGVRRQIAETAAVAAGVEAASASYIQARAEWEKRFVGRAQLLEERCRILSALSDGWIKATLRRGVMGARLAEILSRRLQGARIHSLADKLQQLSDSITSAANPVSHWAKVLEELDALSIKGVAEDATDFDAPQVVAAGFNANDLEKLARKIDRQSWLELSLIELDDCPVFEYRQREGAYIPFEDASAGQQATALLRVLLNQEGPPLIIDQPEDDLDNQVIHEVSEHIGQAKQRRQIIFTSHNANLVVNGDADLVVAFGYRILGEQSGGEVKAEGAIDVKEIRDQITAVMEGGEKAFRLRKEKYGF